MPSTEEAIPNPIQTNHGVSYPLVGPRRQRQDAVRHQVAVQLNKLKRSESTSKPAYGSVPDVAAAKRNRQVA